MMAKPPDPVSTVIGAGTYVWRGLMASGIVVLAFQIGAAWNRIEALESWRKDIAILAETRDQRIRTLEAASNGILVQLTEISRSLRRIEAQLDAEQAREP